MRYVYVGAMMLIAFITTFAMLRLMIASQEDFFVSQSLFDEAAFMACLMGMVEIVVMDVLEIHPLSSEEKQEDLFWIGILGLFTFYFAYRILYQKGTTSKDEFYRQMIVHNSMALKIIREVKPRAFAQDYDFQGLMNKMQTTQEKEIEYMKKHLEMSAF